MTSVKENIEQLASFFDEQADQADELGHLTDDIAKELTDAGVIRMLQPKDFGGLESTPMEWFDALFEIGRHSGAAAWVSGVVGVHPFEIAQGTRLLQEEIWGEDRDTWVASPYAPFGRAKRVDGGYIFNGRWPWSTGTVHCDWTVLGGLIVDDEGTPIPDGTRHFFLPKSDYETLPESWDIVGLSGTGSYDVVVKDAFIPDHRIIDPRDLESGKAAIDGGHGDSALYRMPFNLMFAGTIAGATLAISRGALDAFIDYCRVRQTRLGHVVSKDPHQLATLGAAVSDLEAGELQFMTDMERLWEYAVAGKEIPMDLKLDVRRRQVRAVQRAISAVDDVMRHAGGAAMNRSNPLQRFWRDAHTGAGHGANVAEPKYEAYGLNLFGYPLPEGFRL